MGQNPSNSKRIPYERTRRVLIPGMVPIVFGAGVLLGLLAWSSGSLIPCRLGHVLMDIGLFAYWWTGIAGNFTERLITETGVDRPFLVACAVFTISLLVVLTAMSKLRDGCRPIRRLFLQTLSPR